MAMGPQEWSFLWPIARRKRLRILKNWAKNQEFKKADKKYDFLNLIPFQKHRIFTFYVIYTELIPH
jgi:hypothetical protein